MTWKSITEEELVLCQQMRVWIETAREWGKYAPDWLPSHPDMVKSALFERLRSGLQPLEYPPPIGYACPWYAIVEDQGPHQVAEKEGEPFGIIWQDDRVHLLGNMYRIVSLTKHNDMIVRDAYHDTPYRFHLWFDPEFSRTISPYHPSTKTTTQTVTLGMWLMRNIEFETKGI